MVKIRTSIFYHIQTVIKAPGNYEINTKWFWNYLQSHNKTATYAGTNDTYGFQERQELREANLLATW
jgi:hypothetical protein